MTALWRVLQGPGGVLFLAIVALAAVLPMLSGTPAEQALPPIGVQEAAGAHPLGTDQMGRDMLWQLSRAVAITLLICLTALGGQVVLGTVLGVLFGTLGGAVGRPLVGLAGFLHMLSIPLLALLALAALRVGGTVEALPIQGATLLACVLAVCGWPRIARDAGRALLRERQSAHARAARELGMGPIRLFTRHLQSAMHHPIRLGAMVTLIETVIALILIGVVGLGAQVPTLGALLANGIAVFDRALWWPLAWPLLVTLALLVSLGLITRHVAREARP
ncbi:MAG: ABC transporter permease subunit [Pseudomonadota bacterium]